MISDQAGGDDENILEQLDEAINDNEYLVKHGGGENIKYFIKQNVEFVTLFNTGNSWEESQRVLSRSNFKDKIANFDGRQLLENDDLVSEVRGRIDLSSIKPEQPMAVNLKPPVRNQKERRQD